MTHVFACLPLAFLIGQPSPTSGEGAAAIRVTVSDVWDEEELINLPIMVSDVSSCSTIVGSGQAEVELEATGSFVRGEGSAEDTCNGPEVGVDISRSALHSISYHYLGDRDGEVDVNVEVQVNGEIDLVDGECSASALGFASFDCSILSEVRAELTRSVGASTRSALGTIGVGLGGGPVPGNVSAGFTISTASGLGRRSDSDVESDHGHRCGEDSFFFLSKCRGTVQVWADGNIFGAAESTCELDGNVVATIALSEC